MATTRPDWRGASFWSAAGMACIAGTCHAQLQPWRVEPAISATITRVSNSDYGNSRNGPSDVVLSTIPSLRFGGANARLRINGQVQLENIQYLDQSQADRVLPQATIDGNLKLIDQFVGLDGGLTSQQTAANPLGATSSTLNRYTTTQARVSPYLERELTPSLFLNARASATLAKYDQVGDDVVPRSNTRNLHHTLNLTRKPLPFGAAVELDYQDAASAGNPDAALTQKSTRGVISYKLYQQLVISGIAGRESTATNFRKRSDSLGGGRVEWRADERNQARATVEHHFFGTYWDATFSHRRPTSVATLQLGRQISSSINAPSQVSTGNTLAGANAGLQDVLAVQLQRNVSMRLTFMGRRDTLTFGGDYLRAMPLPEQAQGIGQSSFLQLAANVDFSHRVTPLTTLEMGVRGSRTSRPGTTLKTLEKTLKTSLNVMLSPKTTATVGARYQKLELTQTQSIVHETAVIAGLNHRF